MTPEAVALEIYKTVQVSQSNDAYENYQRDGFVRKITPVIAQALREAVAQEREACARVAEANADHYPPDVFPPVTYAETSPLAGLADRISAHMARQASANIASAIRRRGDES